MSNTDPCVRQNDACKEIFCGEISQQTFDACEKNCMDHPGFIIVSGENGIKCTCMWKHNTFCQSSSPFTQSLKASDMNLELVMIITFNYD
jgi:hypothetical protein